MSKYSLGLKAGDVVEVWDMPLGEWVRARITKSGHLYFARGIRCMAAGRGTAWRAAKENAR